MGKTATALDPKQAYARQVGARLRRVRRQTALSLQDVEVESDHEFKASVLGAYERGERIISVPRLQRLSRIYGVPVDFLLPRGADDASPTAAVRPSAGHPSSVAEPPPARLSFDLLAFDNHGDIEVAMVRQYLYRVQAMRGDFESQIFTIRDSDLSAMASLFGMEREALLARLASVQSTSEDGRPE